MAVIFKKLTATLPSDINTHVFTDSLINTTSVIEIYCNDDDVFPVDVNQTGEHSITVEFSEHSDDVEIAMTINNATTFEPYDDTDVLISINELSTDKQDKLTAGTNITISEDNVISATGGGGDTPSASDVSYDNTTTGIDADNVQNAIDSVFHSVSDGKSLIASAITGKGVPTLATDTFETMATNIFNIPISGDKGLYRFESYISARISSFTLDPDFVGKELYVVLYDGQSGAKATSYLEPIAFINCTSEFITYLTSSSTYVTGCVYKLTDITAPIVITPSHSARLLVFALN